MEVWGTLGNTLETLKNLTKKCEIKLTALWGSQMFTTK